MDGVVTIHPTTSNPSKIKQCHHYQHSTALSVIKIEINSGGASDELKKYDMGESRSSIDRLIDGVIIIQSNSIISNPRNSNQCHHHQYSGSTILNTNGGQYLPKLHQWHQTALKITIMMDKLTSIMDQNGGGSSNVQASNDMHANPSSHQQRQSAIGIAKKWAKKNPMNKVPEYWWWPDLLRTPPVLQHMPYIHWHCSHMPSMKDRASAKVEHMHIIQLQSGLSAEKQLPW